MKITRDSHYQVRGLPGKVNRLLCGDRLVDFWEPKGGSEHLIIAHDGQNIFDRKTATFLHTWKLGPTNLKVANEIGIKAPSIIAVFHSSSKVDPYGRVKDLCPENAFREGIEPSQPAEISTDDLRGNQYLNLIFDHIVPSLINVKAENTSMIGSSLGALATLYAAIHYHDRFHTALALSPHWMLAGNPLVQWMVSRLPIEKDFQIWMSRGTRGLDATYKPHQDLADNMMRERGWDNERFVSQVFPRTSHNERSWAKYVEKPLRFWLGHR